MNLNFYLVEQLAILPPQIFDQPAFWHPEQTIGQWLAPRILELTYTAEDMRPFAEELGYDGEPLVWDEERRRRLRAEIDAAFFHLYLPANADGTWRKCESETEAEYAELAQAYPTPRDAVDYIMESFPITKKKDLAQFGEYKTKNDILRIYDEMQKKIFVC